MKIALDEKHFLNSDQYCYWISCLVTSTNKRTGEEKTVERRVRRINQICVGSDEWLAQNAGRKVT